MLGMPSKIICHVAKLWFSRMAGSIQSGEQQVTWEARKTDSPSSRGRSSAADEPPPPLILSPSDHRQVVESPLPASASIEDSGYLSLSATADVMTTDASHTQTAPAEIGQRHQRLSVQMPPQRRTYEITDQRRRESAVAIQLDPDASKNVPVALEEVKGDDTEEGGGEPSWGESFRVEWLCTERLPFYRIRHLRNPWNHDREVKISRDGTELEPNVGQKLLDEWHTLATATDVPQLSSTGSGNKAKGTITGQRRRLGS